MTLERQSIIKDTKSILPVTFVSFKSRWGAAVCAQTQQSRNPTLWLTNWAPEPRDIYWRNLAIPFISLSIRRLIISIVVFALVFFYMIPIAFVQSLANLEGLERVAPFLRPVIEMYVQSLFQWFSSIIIILCLIICSLHDVWLCNVIFDLRPLISSVMHENLYSSTIPPRFPFVIYTTFHILGHSFRGQILVQKTFFTLARLSTRIPVSYFYFPSPFDYCLPRFNAVTGNSSSRFYRVSFLVLHLKSFYTFSQLFWWSCRKSRGI